MSSSIGQKPTFSCQHLSDEILSNMIENLIENYLVGDSNCVTVNLLSLITRNDN